MKTKPFSILKSPFSIKVCLQLAAILILTAASCNKEQPDPPPDLPPLTHVGAMTFGCYVNGEPWVAQVPPFQAEFRHLSASLNKNTTTILISARRLINQPNINQEIYVRFKYVDLENVLLDDFAIEYSNQSFIDNKQLSYKHKLDTTYNNQVKIVHFELNDNIISGTFNLRAISQTTKDTVTIKDGRFDTLFSVIE